VRKRQNCKLFCVLDVYARHELDVHDWGVFKTDEVGQGEGWGKKSVFSQTSLINEP